MKTIDSISPYIVTFYCSIVLEPLIIFSQNITITLIITATTSNGTGRSLSTIATNNYIRSINRAPIKS